MPGETPGIHQTAIDATITLNITFRLRLSKTSAYRNFAKKLAMTMTFGIIACWETNCSASELTADSKLMRINKMNPWIVARGRTTLHRNRETAPVRSHHKRREWRRHGQWRCTRTR